MTDLHAELSALSVEWPATPDLTEGVLGRLAEPVAPDRRRLAWRPVLAYGLAAVVAAFAITMAVSPEARAAVLEWLGLKSVQVERREPTAPPPSPGALGSGLGLGTARLCGHQAHAGLAGGFRDSPGEYHPEGDGPQWARRGADHRRR